LAWQFESSNVDSKTGLAPNLSTTGTFAAPTGGTITTANGKRFHNFSTVGTTSITFNVPVTAEVLVVAGGGGGGSVSSTTFFPGGGGGAGEVYYSASYFIPAGTYTVTVGDGGAGGPQQPGSSQNGSNSVFGSISAAGGGHGGDSGGAGAIGGSGGGSSREAGAGGLSEKTAGGQGNNGGASTGTSGAGGGGAGGVGVNQTTTGTSASFGSAGGAGVSYPISILTYGVGGSGGSRTNGTSGASGADNTGNGGGGAGSLAGATGGKGGSGRVLISYVSALYPAPTYVTGIYGQAISFNNTLSPAGADPNCYVTYDVSSFGISSNSTTMSLWLKSGLTYPTAAGTTPFYVNLQGVNYNGLFTPSATSTISFRKGTAPATTIGSVTAQTDVWQHHCMVFSNVGAVGTSNTFSSYYVNGSFIATANNTIQGFTTLNLGCQYSGSNGALCSIDDLRLFNTALTAAQVQAIYRTSGMPSLQVMSGAPLFTQLSQAARTSAVGAFSLRAVNGTSARAVNVKKITITDSSSSPVLPTLSTSVTSNVLGPFSTNGSLFYNATGSPWPTPSKMQFDLFTSDNVFMECFVYFSTAPTSNFPALFYRSGQISVYFNNNSTLTLAIYNSTGGNAMSPLTIGSIPLNTWRHVSVSINQQTSTAYASINGSVVSASYTLGGSNYNSSNPFYLLINNPVPVNISSFRCVSGAATLPYITTFTPPSSILTAYSSGTTIELLDGVASSTDFYADRLGNLLTSPVVGQSLANWLGGATGYVTTWYDQSGQGQHMAQSTAANQPVLSVATKPVSLIFTGTEYFQNTVPFTFNFGSGAFTLRYVVSNNTGGLVVYKANGDDFVWSQNEKKFWLGDGTTTETSRGGFPSQVGFSESYIYTASAIGSTKTSVVHKATSLSAIPVYVNETLQTLGRNTLTMGTDPGNFLYFGRGGAASNYIGNIHEIQIFSTAFSDSDRLALEN
jgi:hypothetical protein